MTYATDANYIRECKRLRITPSADDYAQYLADNEVESDGLDWDFD